MAGFGTTTNTGPNQPTYLNPIAPSQPASPSNGGGGGGGIWQFGGGGGGSDQQILSSVPQAPNVNRTAVAPSPNTGCDEEHILPTRWNETIFAGTAVFGAGGTQILLPASGLQNVFEINLQPNAAVSLQIIEGANPITGAGGTPVSGNWTIAANQFWSWRGKYTNQSLSLFCSGAANVQFEIRYRTYA